jgi:hypothetical protein
MESLSHARGYKMVPKTLALPAPHLDALEALATENGRRTWGRLTWADLVRTAVEEFLGRNPLPKPKAEKPRAKRK